YLGSPHAPYNSVPPTSGQHVPQTVACGIYRNPIPEELQVHALEHGHVLIQYSLDLPAAGVRELEGLGRRHPRDVLIAPYPRLDHGVAATAWGRIDRMDGVDLDRLDRFVRAFAGRYDHGWRAGAP